MITKAKNPVCETHYTCRDEVAFQRFESLAARVQDAIDKDVFLPNETSSPVRSVRVRIVAKTGGSYGIDDV